MDRLSAYSIPFAGMAMGSHQFDYEIDDKFFELFENAVISHANAHVKLLFNRSETVLTLEFTIAGTIRQVCDRCLEEFDLEVATHEILLVRFGETASSDTDEIIVIQHGEQTLNVAQHIYDYISLLIPMRAVHPDKAEGIPGCESEYLSDNPQELNENQDPRWDILKNLGTRKN